MLQLRRLAPALARNGGCLRELSTTPTLLQGPGKDKKDDKKEDEDGYELLPPGCSVVDPSYGLSVSDPVYFYDSPRTKKAGKTVPPTPTSLAAAQQKLKDQKDAKAAKQDEDEPYVYLPPGSSMREPGEPMGGRVYYRDPIPVMRKK